jgi:hypothetical protein
MKDMGNPNKTICQELLRFRESLHPPAQSPLIDLDTVT